MLQSNFQATATDDIDWSVAVICTPTSGSLFPIGSTKVDCKATDKAGNTGIASFNIIINQPPKPTGEPTSLTLSIKLKRAIATGQDYSLSGRLTDGATGRKLVGGQVKSFTSEPSFMNTIPDTKTDGSGKFSLSGLKIQGNVGTFKIIAHFKGNSILQGSDSNTVLLKLGKHTTTLMLQVKGSSQSGSSLFGTLSDTVSRGGIVGQAIAFTTDKSGLEIHDAVTDTKGKYEEELSPIQCGIGSIQIQSHFAGNDVLKSSDSKVSVLPIPRCPTQSQSSPSFDINPLTNLSLIHISSPRD